MPLTVRVTGGIAQQFKRVADKLGSDIDKRVHKFAEVVLDDLVEQTPKLSGQASANWQVSIGVPKGVFIELREAIKNGVYDSAAVGDAKVYGLAIISEWKFSRGMALHISNYAPYIKRLNEGYSDKAPARYIEAIVEQRLEAIRRL